MRKLIAAFQLLVVQMQFTIGAILIWSIFGVHFFSSKVVFSKLWMSLFQMTWKEYCMYYESHVVIPAERIPRTSRQAGRPRPLCRRTHSDSPRMDRHLHPHRSQGWYYLPLSPRFATIPFSPHNTLRMKWYPTHPALFPHVTMIKQRCYLAGRPLKFTWATTGGKPGRGTTRSFMTSRR